LQVAKWALIIHRGAPPELFGSCSGDFLDYPASTVIYRFLLLNGNKQKS
jgi:hypothetical protein